ncbi:MAG: SAM-dependent methyltransferase [Nevskia sp.]|nr:SAM-dependent methyltransferase [Nevskia sp.]
MTAVTPDAAELALVDLLQWLRTHVYRFVTPTPLTHSRVIARAEKRSAQSLRDILGWSLPFTADAIDAEALALMRAAGVVHEQAGVLRSAIRVSSLDDDLYLHSAYPTDAADAVFFGPDTYRYCRFVAAELDKLPRPQAPRMADVGCGSGAGGIVAARHLRQPTVLLTDINPLALRLARVNAAVAGVDAETLLSDVLTEVSGALDLVISNPPYLNDDQRRAYRHGGGTLGFDLSLRIAVQALERLRVGGVLLLYTGVAIVDGEDPFLQALRQLFTQTPCDWRYREIDPDVFGEELQRPVYRQVDRIAAVGLVAVKRAA